VSLTFVFEIWFNPDDRSYELSPVSLEADRLRYNIAPRSILQHSFVAVSDFDAMRKSHVWHKWAAWTPEPDWVERHFTIEGVAKQKEYLRARNSLG